MANINDLITQAERVARGVTSFATGKVSAVVNRSRGPKADMSDATLKAKVETELFRDADAPKGDVDVVVVDGVVELRGQVKRPEIKKALETKARKIPEVRDVENLLHLPKTPAPTRADSPGKARRKASTGTTGRFSSAESEPGREAAPLGSHEPSDPR